MFKELTPNLNKDITRILQTNILYEYRQNLQQNTNKTSIATYKMDSTPKLREFIPGMQNEFNLYKAVNVIHYIIEKTQKPHCYLNRL